MCTSMKWRRVHAYKGGCLSSHTTLSTIHPVYSLHSPPFHSSPHSYHPTPPHPSTTLPTHPTPPLHYTPHSPHPNPPLHYTPHSPHPTPPLHSPLTPPHPTPPLHSPLTPPKPSPAFPQCPASSHVPRWAGDNRRPLPCCLQLHGHTRRLPQLSTTAHLLRRKGACCIAGVGLAPSS